MIDQTLTRDHLKLLLAVFEDDLKDLDRWDAYNNDILNEELAAMRKAFHALKERIDHGR